MAVSQSLASSQKSDQTAELTPLSARQAQCIRLTAFRTDREIAAHLGISEATVKKHVHEACQRLGVNRRKAALALLEQMDAAAEAASKDVGATPVVEVAPEIAPGAEPAISPVTTPAPAGRFGYRPPPRNPLFRLALIVGLIFVLALMTVGIAILVSDFHNLMDRFDPHRAPSAPVAASV